MAQTKVKIAISDPDDHSLQSLNEIIGYSLKRAYIVFADDFKKQPELKDISSRQFAALALVVCLPNVNQSEVARQLGIERSGIVKVIDDLERLGLVNRVAVPGDRRSHALVATQAGQEKFRDYKRAIAEHEAGLLTDFTEPEKAQFLEFLLRVQAKA